MSSAYTRILEMITMGYHAYFYDKANKTELFCTVTPTHNYGRAKTDAEEAARKKLPKNIEEFLMLKAEKVIPFGSLLSDALSIDFSGAMEFIDIMRYTDTPKEEFPGDNLGCSPLDIFLFSPLHKFLISAREETKQWEGVWKYVKQLYVIRKYIEMCIERPSLYSFGQFQQLLKIIDKSKWYPQTLGFFTPAEGVTSGQYFFNDLTGRRRYEDSLSRHFNEASRLQDLEKSLQYDLLNESTKGFLPPPHLEFFKISNVVDAVLLSLFHLLQEGTAIKKCANCNKLFVPLVRADAIYCDRQSPQDSGKTCKEYGSKVLWYENVINDDVAKLARNIYCSKQMLAKRNPDKPEYAEMFKYFKVEKKRWEQQVKAGTKSREEFAEWLRAMKLRKTPGELEGL